MSWLKGEDTDDPVPVYLIRKAVLPPSRQDVKRTLYCVKYCLTRAVCKLTGKTLWTAPSL